MDMRVTRLLLLCLLLVSGGCTYVETRSDAQTQQAISMPVPAGKSMIYIVRPSFISYSNRHYNVQVNGRHLGKLGSSHFFTLLVEPGQYLVTTNIDPAFGSQLVSSDLVMTTAARKIESILDDGEGVLVKAEPGKKYYVRLAVGVLGAKLEMAKDQGLFSEGMFSQPSLVDIITFTGKGLKIK